MSRKQSEIELPDRRHFIKSLFGLGTALDAAEAPAQAQNKSPAPDAKPAQQPGSFRFYWTDLRTGQIGFPSGQVVGSGMPGSLMKLVAAAALLESRILKAEEKFECRGTYACDKHESVHCLYPHGMVDMPRAIGLSCNIYFAQAVHKLSPTVFLRYAKDFGFSAPVGAFPSGEFPAKAQYPTWKYALGLAPDFQPTALQIMRMSALVANRGSVPYMHSAEAPDPNGEPFVLHLKENTFEVLQQGMEIACRQGTGKKLDPLNTMHIALKTGTTPHGKAFQSWVTGYFPWKNPRYAFCLRSQAGTSYDQAIPALKKFLFGTKWP